VPGPSFQSLKGAGTSFAPFSSCKGCAALGVDKRLRLTYGCCQRGVVMFGETASLLALQPSVAARELAREADPEWLATFVSSLDLGTARADLARVLKIWGLSQAGAAELFGVSRQAVGKWLRRGVPGDRIEVVGRLAAATDILVRHLKAGRVPAVVRRPSDRLGGRSLLNLVKEGRTREVLMACRQMFRFAEAQAL